MEEGEGEPFASDTVLLQESSSHQSLHQRTECLPQLKGLGYGNSKAFWVALYSTHLSFAKVFGDVEEQGQVSLYLRNTDRVSPETEAHFRLEKENS